MAGLVSHIVEQDDGPLSRNRQLLSQGNPRTRMDGASALALQCHFVELMRHLAASPNWAAIVNEALLAKMSVLSKISGGDCSSLVMSSTEMLSSAAALLVLSDIPPVVCKGASVFVDNEHGTVVALSENGNKAKVVLKSANVDASGCLESVDVAVSELSAESAVSGSIFDFIHITKACIVDLMSCVKFFEKHCNDEAIRENSVAALVLDMIGSLSTAALASALDASLRDAQKFVIQDCIGDLIDCLRAVSVGSSIPCQARSLHLERQTVIASCLDALLEESSNSEASSDVAPMVLWLPGIGFRWYRHQNCNFLKPCFIGRARGI